VEREIKKIVVHCSDSEWGDADAIDRWHKEMGWDGIGYNFVLMNGHRVNSSPDSYDAEHDGLFQVGRPIDIIPAHVRGHNKHSIGICVIGKRFFSHGQFTALEAFLKDLILQYGLSVSDVVGHYELDENKTCPNMDMDDLRCRLMEGFHYDKSMKQSPN